MPDRTLDFTKEFRAPEAAAAWANAKSGCPRGETTSLWPGTRILRNPNV